MTPTKPGAGKPSSATPSTTGGIASVPLGSTPPTIVRLSRTPLQAQPDLLLWIVIKGNASQLCYENYAGVMDTLLCGDVGKLAAALTSSRETVLHNILNQPFVGLLTNADVYHLLRAATEAFVTLKCAVVLPDAFKVDAAIPSAIADIDVVPPIKATGATGLWDSYLEKMNGTKDLTLPYLKLVRDKLASAPLIVSFLEQVFEERSKLKMSTKLEEHLNDLEKCYTKLRDKLTRPIFFELIWSYWHEEGMLVQTMNAISRRFQNMVGPDTRDPLAILDVDPLRPLNNLLWGYIQDEQFRLSVVRRAYEYNHQYGLTLEGKAVPPLRPADTRRRFLESFHNLLHLASIFYRQDDDTTVRADGFPMLNALKDLHMLLVEGAHNQYGDLPTQARVEMLMQQWLLARPEFREFLPTRVMVAYPEPWMDRVDAMKKLQGWGEVSIIHFHELAEFGEQLLLSIRFGNWNDINATADQAAVWARFWRSQIQGYIHAYRAVTGVDLSADSIWEQQRGLVTAQPSALLQRRLLDGRVPPMLPVGRTTVAVGAFRQRRAARRVLAR